MLARFRIGDHVSWNSDVGRVTGEITKVHRKDFQFLGKQRRASEDEPQYEVKSEKTGNLAAHKGDALTRRK